MQTSDRNNVPGLVHGLKHSLKFHNDRIMAKSLWSVIRYLPNSITTFLGL